MSGLAAVSESDYDRLVREGRALYRDAEGSWETTKERAVRCGAFLSQVKATLKHGQWGRYLADVGIPEATARRYRRFAEQAKSVNLTDLWLGDVLAAVEDKRVREHQRKMRALSAKFDRLMDVAYHKRRPDRPIPLRDEPDLDLNDHRIYNRLVEAAWLLRADRPPVSEEPHAAILGMVGEVASVLAAIVRDVAAESGQGKAT